MLRLALVQSAVVSTRRRPLTPAVTSWPSVTDTPAGTDTLPPVPATAAEVTAKRLLVVMIEGNGNTESGKVSAFRKALVVASTSLSSDSRSSLLAFGRLPRSTSSLVVARARSPS
ncbi:hypothetical protein D3C86_1613330 [compost metagenome]